MTEVLLKIDNFSVRYGQLEVVHDVSFDVLEGQVTCLIGANGAGKSTTLNALAGHHSASSGTAAYAGKQIQLYRPHRIAKERIALVPEGRRVFSSLSTLQNLKMGAFPVRGGWRSPGDLAEVFALFPELEKVRDTQAGLLSGGQQQMLAIGRALMSRPRLLILDEPSMGLAPLLVDRIFETLNALKGTGVTILLAEQNARLALRLADRAYVLELGHVVEHGSAGELRDSSRVGEIYLGG